MAIYAVGNEADSFQAHAGSLFPYSQGNTKAPGARYGMIATSSNRLRLDLNTAVSEAWVHLHTYPSGARHDTEPVMLWYDRTNARGSLRWVTPSSTGSSSRHVLQVTSNGSSWTDIVEFIVPASSNNVVDIYFKGGSSGEVKVFVGGQLQASATGNYAMQDSTFDAIIFGSAINSTHYWGSIIVASECTINWAVDTIEINGSGNSSDWTGSYFDVYDSYYNEADYITTNSTGQKFLADLASMNSLPNGRNIKCVAIHARGLISSGAVSTVNFLARHSSTDYTLDDTGLVSGNGVASCEQILELNPAGGAWTKSDVDAFQAGVISA